jgi:hypothetical protein
MKEIFCGAENFGEFFGGLSCDDFNLCVCDGFHCTFRLRGENA